MPWILNSGVEFIDLGVILVTFLSPFEVLRALGRSWGGLGESWGSLGRPLGAQGSPKERFGSRFGLILEPF